MKMDQIAHKVYKQNCGCHVIKAILRFVTSEIEIPRESREIVSFELRSRETIFLLFLWFSTDFTRHSWDIPVILTLPLSLYHFTWISPYLKNDTVIFILTSIVDMNVTQAHDPIGLVWYACGQFVGSTLAVSSGRQLNVTFITDSSVQRDGFFAYYSATTQCKM